MNFYNNYKNLCNCSGKTPSGVALELGFAKSAVNNWKKGKLPNAVTLLKISEYFDVSVDYILGLSEKEPLTAQQEQERQGMGALKNVVTSLSDAELSKLIDYALFLASQHNQSED